MQNLANFRIAKNKTKGPEFYPKEEKDESEEKEDKLEIPNNGSTLLLTKGKDSVYLNVRTHPFPTHSSLC